MSSEILTYVKSKTFDLRCFCCFLTDLDQGKKYASFQNYHVQHNIRKRNHLLATAFISVSILVSKQVLR